MKKKQRVSMVVAQLLGLCLSLWSVSAMAECRTYNLYGDLWFSDRRTSTLSQAQWLTLGPAPNVEVELFLAAERFPTPQDFEPDQPAHVLCPSGVDCNSEDFDDYEGATNIYTDLNGHWSVDVILCLREPVGEYGIKARPIFKMQTPEWKIVNESLEVYQVFGRMKPLMASDSAGALDYGITGVPWFNSLEDAMWVFQSMREAWNFVEVDGGCSRFTTPCGFDLGRTEPITVLTPRNVQAEQRVRDGQVPGFGCQAAGGCSLGADRLTTWGPAGLYHEYGHTVLSNIFLRNGVDYQATYIAYGYPYSEAHEDWGNFTQSAILGNLMDYNSCSLDELRTPPYLRPILVDLYDLVSIDVYGNNADCDKSGIGVCDWMAHGYGMILQVFDHMTTQKLIDLKNLGNSMNQLGRNNPAAQRTYIEGWSALFFDEAMEIWGNLPGYREGMAELFLLNCIPLRTL